MEELLHALFEHNAWANHKVLAAAGRMPLEDWQAMPGGMPNIRSLLVHIFEAEMGWRLGIERNAGWPTTDAEEFATPADLATAWAADEAENRAWVFSQTPEQLRAVRHRGRGRPGRPLWQFITHVIMHGAQHRAEVAAMLTEIGRSPGGLDFLNYIGSTDR